MATNVVALVGHISNLNIGAGQHTVRNDEIRFALYDDDEVYPGVEAMFEEVVEVGGVVAIAVLVELTAHTY